MKIYTTFTYDHNEYIIDLLKMNKDEIKDKIKNGILTNKYVKILSFVDELDLIYELIINDIFITNISSKYYEFDVSYNKEVLNILLQQNFRGKIPVDTINNIKKILKYFTYEKVCLNTQNGKDTMHLLLNLDTNKYNYSILNYIMI